MVADYLSSEIQILLTKNDITKKVQKPPIRAFSDLQRDIQFCISFYFLPLHKCCSNISVQPTTGAARTLT